MSEPRFQVSPARMKGDPRRAPDREAVGGLSKKDRLAEAIRCPQCQPPPCRPGCPLDVDIPGFIRFLREDRRKEALAVLLETNPLPGVTSRLCHAPCEAHCVFEREGTQPIIAIRDLERSAAQMTRVAYEEGAITTVPFRAAVVGSGPAGLAAAVRLRQKGWDVDVYEAMPVFGGTLRTTPAFHLPRKVLEDDLSRLTRAGVKWYAGVNVGRNHTMSEILDSDVTAVILATGAGFAMEDRLPGTESRGVFSVEEILWRMAFPELQGRTNRFSGWPFSSGARIVVLGTGGRALEGARACLRYGCPTTMIRLPSDDTLRVSERDRSVAIQEGLVWEPMVEAVAVVSDASGCVTGVECRRLDFADPDSSGRWRLMPVPDSTFHQSADGVLVSSSVSSDRISERLAQGWGCGPDEIGWNPSTGLTSRPNVWAAGACVGEGQTLVEAMASGLRVAETLMNWVQEGSEDRACHVR